MQKTKKSQSCSFRAIHPSSWKKEKLNQLLNKSFGKKILVIGDLGLDRYTIGTVDRISPEAPVPIVCVQEERLKLGLAANVADNIHSLSGIPFLVGVIGLDRSGEDFQCLLKSIGVSVEHLVIDQTRRTVLKERVVCERQQLVRIDYENLNLIENILEKEIIKKISELILSVDGIVIEDYAKGLLTKSLIQKIFKLAQKENKIVAVDPNIKTPINYYRGATVLTPNLKEAACLSGITIGDQASLIQAGKILLKKTHAQFVVITRGKDGMAIFSKKTSIIQLIPTCAREVYDVSGAGDTVISVLILALVSGASIEEASILGNLAAGVEVGKSGTATVTVDEIRHAIGFFQTVERI